MATKHAAPAAPAAAQTAQTFDWDSLPAAEVPEYTRSVNLPKDVESTTPQAIKVKLMESLDAYEAPIPAGTKDDKGNVIPERKSPKLSWRVQECGTVERAKEFQKLAKRYALGHTVKDDKGNDVSARFTLRSAIVDSTVTGAATVVRFMAKPFEARDNDAKS